MLKLNKIHIFNNESVINIILLLHERVHLFTIRTFE